MGNICADERPKPVDTDREKLKRSVKEMQKALKEARSVDDNKYEKRNQLTVRDTRAEQDDLLGLHSESRDSNYLQKPNLLGRRKRDLGSLKTKSAKSSDSIK